MSRGPGHSTYASYIRWASGAAVTSRIAKLYTHFRFALRGESRNCRGREPKRFKKVESCDTDRRKPVEKRNEELSERKEETCSSSSWPFPSSTRETPPPSPLQGGKRRRQDQQCVIFENFLIYLVFRTKEVLRLISKLLDKLNLINPTHLGKLHLIRRTAERRLTHIYSRPLDKSNSRRLTFFFCGN